MRVFIERRTIMDGRWSASILDQPSWRSSAGLIREAMGQGHPLETIAEQTGVANRILHQWLVAEEVYNVLDWKVIGESLRPQLEREEGVEILYSLRRIPLEDRSAAVRWLLERQLPASASEGLVQAIKDCRRFTRAEKAGPFTCEPQNALAFQKWRQARVTTDPAERRRHLEEGLLLTDSEDVRALFQQAVIQEGAQPNVPRRQELPWPPVRRMGSEDRPIIMPYVEDPALLADTPPAVPSPSETPSLSVWIPAGRYAVLPKWPELIGIRRPAAVSGILLAARPDQDPPATSPVDDETEFLILETAPVDPRPGGVVLVLEDGGVRAMSADSITPVQREAVVGVVVLRICGKPRRLLEVDHDDEDMALLSG